VIFFCAAQRSGRYPADLRGKRQLPGFPKHSIRVKTESNDLPATGERRLSTFSNLHSASGYVSV
jgi:hypothetical protein